MNKKNIYKPQPISGFPEWTPEIRRAEQIWFDQIRKTFESYGFCNIETPSVETLDTITAKGGDGEADVDKEVYVLERLHKDDNSKEARLALHFDQTVPLARYTAQHFNALIFPFKRYQIQRVWRGERPQAGRFREFYQCDIDVINIDQLPLHFDAEMPAIMWEILSGLPGMEDEKITIRLSNRKILIGFLEGKGVQNIVEVTRWIDKMDKIDHKAIRHELSTLGLNADLIDSVFDLVDLKTSKSKDLKNHTNRITPQNHSMKEGIEELAFVLDQLTHLPEGAVVADLAIVRGLDYYTGTVYETVFTDDPAYGSICSGGRYDDLASNYINKNLPGVGISLGFSRLFDRIRTKGKLPKLGTSPADILVVLPSEERRPIMMETANILRSRGVNVETFHSPSKLKKQMSYAEKKGIPYVWFPPFEDGLDHEIKHMQDGAQTKADPKEWNIET